MKQKCCFRRSVAKFKFLSSRGRVSWAVIYWRWRLISTTSGHEKPLEFLQQTTVKALIKAERFTGFKCCSFCGYFTLLNIWTWFCSELKNLASLKPLQLETEVLQCNLQAQAPLYFLPSSEALSCAALASLNWQTLAVWQISEIWKS